MVALFVLGISLLIGVWGYRYFAGLGWTDSLLNASMILTGMCPVNQMTDEDAKIFASLYAIYIGVALGSISAVFFAPLAHRIPHLFHAEDKE